MTLNRIINGRVARFDADELVSVAHQAEPRRIIGRFLDPVSPPGYSHCSGKSARYQLDDGQIRWDYELGPLLPHQHEKIQKEAPGLVS